MLEGAVFVGGGGTLEGGGINVAAPENIEDLAGVLDAAVVGTADDGKVAIREAVAFDRAGAGDGEGLEGFEGRTDKGAHGRITGLGEQAPAMVGNHRCDAMGGFKNTFSEELYF